MGKKFCADFFSLKLRGCSAAVFYNILEKTNKKVQFKTRYIVFLKNMHLFGNETSSI